MSGARQNINTAGSAGSPTEAIRIATGDFTGSSIVVPSLIGKTAQSDFDVWSAGGAGTLLNTTSGYTFVSGTGTISLVGGASDILVLLYNP